MAAMQSQKNNSLAALFVALAFTSATHARGLSFEYLSGDQFGANPSPTAISGNGKFVVGGEWVGSNFPGTWVWSRTGGFVDLDDGSFPPLDTPWVGRPMAIVDNGSIIVGEAFERKDVLGGNWRSLAFTLPRNAAGSEPDVFHGVDWPHIDPVTTAPPSRANDTAFVEHEVIMVGVGGDGEATVWHNGNPTVLHSVAGPDGDGRSFGEAIAISPEGSTAVGWSDSGTGQNVATRWDISSGAATNLGELKPSGWSQATHVSADGSVVVGFASAPNGKDEAFRWTAATGMVGLGALSPGEVSMGDVVSPDGNMVFGRSLDGPFGNLVAFVWTEAGGMRTVDSFLSNELGLATPAGTNVVRINDIALDGETIVGSAWAWGGFIAEIGCLDSDDDGLCDDWETNGIDINGDGTTDLPIHQWGATPDHKDLFVEVDAMVGFAPPAQVKTLVEGAFADAPLTNLDGVDGVRLHFIVDEQNVPVTGFGTDPGETNNRAIAWSEFDTVRNTHFGTPAERGDANWNNIKAARLAAFRYVIWGQKIGSGGPLGRAEILGNDLMMGFKTPTATMTKYSAADMAAIFMHEFGHNLGLQHGGADDVNFKPNYVSIMNYMFTISKPYLDGTWEMKYSAQDLGLLDEANLDETAGLPNLTDALLATRKTAWKRDIPDGSGVDGNGLVDASPLDWNGDGDDTDTSTAVDLNTFRPGVMPSVFPEVLHSYDDWSNAHLPPRGSLNFSDFSTHVSTTADLPDEEDMEATFDALNNVGAGGCAADLDGDSLVDGSDLAALLSQWGGAGDADLTGDGTVDGADLAVMLAAWGACP